MATFGVSYKNLREIVVTLNEVKGAIKHFCLEDASNANLQRCFEMLVMSSCEPTHFSEYGNTIHRAVTEKEWYKQTQDDKKQILN